MTNRFERGALRAGGEELKGGRQSTEPFPESRPMPAPSRIEVRSRRWDKSVRLVRLQVGCFGQTRNPDIETIRAQTRERVRKYGQRRPAVTNRYPILYGVALDLLGFGFGRARYLPGDRLLDAPAAQSAWLELLHPACQAVHCGVSGSWQGVRTGGERDPTVDGLDTLIDTRGTLRSNIRQSECSAGRGRSFR
jgi:hypothetical protein